jgi:predicted nucleic acid-binding protein
MIMKFVFDTSIVVAVITNEIHKPVLIDKTRGAYLLAPSSLPFEIGNAISAMFKRNRISLEQAFSALEAFEKIPIQLCDVNLNRSVELAQILDIYAYDAYFIECAQTYKSPLLSLDQGLVDAATKIGIKSIEV